MTENTAAAASAATEIPGAAHRTAHSYKVFGKVAGETRKGVPSTPDAGWSERAAEGFDGAWQAAYVPRANPGYVFRKETLEDVLHFLERPFGHGLYLAGPTGCGKTSLITEVCARLRWPCTQVTFNGRLEFDSLVGRPTVVAREGQSAIRFMYGPLARAMKLGHVLVLNELDLADPAELSGLNDVLDGRPLVIAGNGGEVLAPHPYFRIVATGNTTGQGDATGLYQGVQLQNVAAMDRYRTVLVSYPKLHAEVRAVMAAAPGLSEPVAAGMVKMAGRVRKLFLGADAGGSETLSVTMSTRMLCLWAQMAMHYAGDFADFRDALWRAWDLAFFARVADAAERATVASVAKAVFGADYRGPDADEASGAGKEDAP
ncbi:MAG: AAA family ATPase [Duodenibacillus sp.]|nr:AAA family ATPase [Duodenibacillus sp.]